MTLANYRDLRVWQSGMDLVEDIYRITQRFPKFEVYGLAGQAQRAAVSVPSNIAEGYTRQHRNEYIQYLAVAQASLAEVDTHLEIAKRLRYVSQEEHDRLRDRIVSLSKQLFSLRRRLSQGHPMAVSESL